jgi:hypothetical protein
MIANDRQKIYLEIMSLVLPMARNVQTWGVLRRAVTDLYPELELIHGLPRLIGIPDFSMQDVYWINTQAANYIDHYKKNKERWDSVAIRNKIAILIGMLPADLRGELVRYDTLAGGN